jgi:hypothetical protein
METSYDVRVWKTEVYKGARKTTHTVRWSVGGRRRKKTHGTAALAEAFRSELFSAARRGEAFVVDSGLPISVHRAEQQVSWFDFARQYAVMKWPHLAPNSRRNTARALTNVTLALLATGRGKPTDDQLRKAFTAWAFNVRTHADEPPEEIAAALDGLGRSTRDVGDLGQPSVVRSALDAFTRRADGTTAAPATIQRQRGVLVNVGSTPWSVVSSPGTRSPRSLGRHPGQ